MVIKSFVQLTENEKKRLYQTLAHKKMFQHPFELYLYLTHANFGFGSESYVLLEQGNILAIMAVISKHTTKTGELCIPLFDLRPSSKLGLRTLLDLLSDLYIDLKPTHMKIGLRPEDENMARLLLREGIRQVDRAIVYEKQVHETIANNMQGVQIVPLQDNSHYDTFISVYNEAFRNDPHVHEIDENQLNEMISSAGDENYIGFIQRGKEKIGVYEIADREAENGEKYGWIETIALLPSARGQGIGNLMLNELITMLTKKGAVRIRLRAYENNHSAVALYERNGFCKKSIHSVWYLFRRDDDIKVPASRNVRRRGKRKDLQTERRSTSNI